jgi:hypothetical protein
VLCFSDSSVFSLGDNALAVRSPARVKKGRKENGERAARINFILALRVAGSLYFRPF